MKVQPSSPALPVVPLSLDIHQIIINLTSLAGVAKRNAMDTFIVIVEVALGLTITFITDLMKCPTVWAER